VPIQFAANLEKEKPKVIYPHYYFFVRCSLVARCSYLLGLLLK